VSSERSGCQSLSETKRIKVDEREGNVEKPSSGAVLVMTLGKTLGTFPTTRRFLAELRADIAAAVNLGLSKVSILNEQGGSVEFSIEGDSCRSAMDVAQSLCAQIGDRESPLHEGIHTCHAVSIVMKTRGPGPGLSGGTVKSVCHADSSFVIAPCDSFARPLVESGPASSGWLSGAAECPGTGTSGLLVPQQSTVSIRPRFDVVTVNHQQASDSSTSPAKKVRDKGEDEGAAVSQSRETTEGTGKSETKLPAGCIATSAQRDEAFRNAIDDLLQMNTLLPPPEQPDFESLVRACKLGKTGDIEIALLHGFNVDARHSVSGNTLLHFAAANGHKKICKLLLRMRADINAANNVGDTALHCALALNYRELGGYLYSKGADDSIPNHRGETCYETARGHSLAPDARTLGPYSVGVPRDLTASLYESEAAVAPSGPCAAEKASNKADPASTQDNIHRMADPAPAPIPSAE
jgi:hypothetical protein